MAPSKALAQLALRKRFLIAESDAYRLVLASELTRLMGPTRWWERLRPVLVVAAPVAGFWLTRRSKGMKRWAVAGWGALRLLKTLRSLLHRSPSR
jgi:hypothetical protein